MHSTLLSCLVLAAPALGQRGSVSPAHFAQAEGNAAALTPLPLPPARVLQIHQDVVGAQARPILGLAFRRDGLDRNPYPAFSVTLSAFCSSAATTTAAPASAFDGNHGSDKRQVIDRRTFAFPATSPVLVPPAPFDYTLLFDVPFLFTGPAPFCWELQLFSGNVPDGVRFDTVNGAGAANPAASSFSYGTGCLATGRTVPMTCLAQQSADWHLGSATFNFGGQGGPANAPGVAVIGFDATNFSGLPLPFAIPGSTGAPSGTCSILTSGVILLSAGFNAAGGMNLPITFALDPAMNGTTVFHQVWAIDLPANPTGLVTSSGLGRPLLAPFLPDTVARVQFVGSSSIANGFAEPGRGAITLVVR